MLRVGMPHRTLRVHFWDAERPRLRSHAERGNDHNKEQLQAASFKLQVKSLSDLRLVAWRLQLLFCDNPPPA